MKLVLTAERQRRCVICDLHDNGPGSQLGNGNYLLKGDGGVEGARAGPWEWVSLLCPSPQHWSSRPAAGGARCECWGGEREGEEGTGALSLVMFLSWGAGRLLLEHA